MHFFLVLCCYAEFQCLHLLLGSIGYVAPTWCSPSSAQAWVGTISRRYSFYFIYFFSFHSFIVFSFTKIVLVHLLYISHTDSFLLSSWGSNLFIWIRTAWWVRTFRFNNYRIHFLLMHFGYVLSAFREELGSLIRREILIIRQQHTILKIWFPRNGARENKCYSIHTIVLDGFRFG